MKNLFKLIGIVAIVAVIGFFSPLAMMAQAAVEETIMMTTNRLRNKLTQNAGGVGVMRDINCYYNAYD